MKKQIKLILSCFTFVMAVLALCFGVYSSLQVTYQIGGNIHYDIENAYVDIETRVYSSPTILDYATGAQIAHDFVDVNLNNITQVAGENGLTLKGTYNQTSLGEEFNSSLLTELSEMDYSSTNGYAYFFVINIKNKTTTPVSAIIQDELTLPQNSWSFNTGYVAGFDNSTTNNNLIIAMGLSDPATPIESTSFSFGINIDLGDLKPTTEKYTISGSNLSINNDAKGVVAISLENAQTNLTLTSSGSEVTHVLFLGDTSKLTAFASGGIFRTNTNLQMVTIPKNIKKLPSETFFFCTSLCVVKFEEGSILSELESVSAPSGVFAYCPIISMILPDTLVTLGGSAFYCTTMNELVIPAGVSYIDAAALGNANIKSLTIKNSTPPSLSAYSLEGLEVENIFVPSQSVASYKSASGWSAYAEKIKAIV